MGIDETKWYIDSLTCKSLLILDLLVLRDDHFMGSRDGIREKEVFHQIPCYDRFIVSSNCKGDIWVIKLKANKKQLWSSVAARMKTRLTFSTCKRRFIALLFALHWIYLRLRLTQILAVFVPKFTVWCWIEKPQEYQRKYKKSTNKNIKKYEHVNVQSTMKR